MMHPPSYDAAIKRLRQLADRIEALASAEPTPQHRRMLTLNIHIASAVARKLAEDHRKWVYRKITVKKGPSMK
jgi:hypothetical protein